jgi:predicted ATPase/DNA-binding SARP family transcriptional activator
MSDLKLFLLGSPRLERDGVPLDFDTRRKNVALVAYLAVTDQRHSRETLVTLLWPELEPNRARAGLRRNLSVLNKILEREWLIVDRELVGTDPDADLWLDVDQFHRLLSAWRDHNHLETDVCADCLTALAEAVGLYRDDFLAGFSLSDSASFDEWQFFQAESLRRELASALERLVRGHSAQGEYEPAIRYAQSWLALDPLHEPVQRWLMYLYARTGQRTAALRQYQKCVRILEEELGLFPSKETTSLYKQIRTGQIGAEESPIPVAAPRHNLPVQSTRFIGRQGLIADIRERLQNPDCRLLTLVGSGGSGKTRLALEAAAVLLNEFLHGVFFVPLAPLQSVKAISPTVAWAIGFSFYEAVGDDREDEFQRQLLDYLRQREMLLILDNFEHLLDGVALVADILNAAPGVKVLVTSRARLNLQSEHLFSVAGMDLPDSAAELFVTSARRVRPGFGLTTDNLADVIRVCHLVEGMPLGILLAAAWVQILSPATIAAQISRSIDFLEANLRDLPERHRSMRAVFDHSWTLLTLRERAVMQALSIFRGTFTWKAAQQIADVSLQELRALVDKSLLHCTPTDRFEVHELLRQYAEERLDREPAASQAMHDRHCAYYTSALQQWELDLKGFRQQQALAEMDVEIENARVAWNWAVAQGQVERLDQTLDALGLFYTRRSRYEEGATLCHAAAESLQTVTRDDTPRVRAKALAWQGAFERELGRIEIASHLLQHSLDLVEGLGLSGQDTRAERAAALLRLGEIAYDSDRREAWGLFEQSLALYQGLGDRWRTAHVLRALGSAALNLGDYGRAKQSYEESLAIRRALGDQWGIANSLQGLSRVALSLGEIEQGERIAREGIALSEEIGDQAGIVKGLGNLSLLLQWSGQFPEAQALLERSAAICNDLGFRVGLVYAQAFLSAMAGHAGEYEPARALAYKCLALARETGHSWALGWSLMLLGGIALVENAYDMAWTLCQESLSVYREARQQDTTGFPLVLSAVAAFRSGQISRAQQVLCEALQLAVITGAFEPSVTTVAAAALFLAEQGQPERAAELYATASRYPLVSKSCWYRDLFGQPIAAVAAALPPDTVAAAQERGRARDLGATVAELLVRLEESRQIGK